MDPVPSDEWNVIQRVLPPGWAEQARATGAFRRARYLKTPAELLRILLLRAVSDVGLRGTVEHARASGIAAMSDVALLKRLRTSREWLRWIAAGLSERLRSGPLPPKGMRVRAVDSTIVSKPASKGTDWRVHYTLDLVSMACDWHELTDSKGGESLERIPIDSGDVILGDRNFGGLKGIQHVVSRGGHVLVRMRWRGHLALVDGKGRPVHIFRLLRKLRVGEVGDWHVEAVASPGEQQVHGRVVAVKLPAPLAEKAVKRVTQAAIKKGKRLDPLTIEAARYIFVFTTLPEKLLSTTAVLELYRYRWQIELAFKRHKQILKLGRLPHQDPRAAESWILAKLLIALLLETFYRSAVTFSPWGYPLAEEESPTVALQA